MCGGCVMSNASATTNWRIILPGLLLLSVLVLVLYRDTALYLARLWLDWKEGGYSHGFLVVLLSAYMVYSDRVALSRSGACPCFYALPLVALCALVWSLAGLANTQLVQALVLLPLALSIVWALAGFGVMRQMLLPVLFVGLAIPVWSPLLPLLQDITAESAYWLTRASGIPAFLEDFTIHLPSGRLSIEDACSGLHYLLAGLTLGVFYAWLNYRAIHHRVLVVMLAAAASILANVLRVFIITWLAHRTDMQHPYVQDHLSLGWYLFGVLVFMLLMLDLLVGRHVVVIEDKLPAIVDCNFTNAWRYAAVLLVSVLLASGPLVNVWLGGAVHYPASQTVRLPAGESGWQGPQVAIDNWRPQFRGAATATAKYSKASDSVYLYVGYYAKQQQGAELINELNRIANTDAWQIGTQTVIAAVPGRPEVIEAELDSLYAGKRLVWYRYRVAGRYTTSNIGAKLFQVAGILTGRAGASVVAVVDRY